MTRTDVHAALADDRRLAIVDALVLSDLTPGALADITGSSSNLLAHHLSVLESAGVVRRRRSEADARRTYVSLDTRNPVVAATAGVARVAAPGRIVFVCSQNSARSQMAASLLADRGAQDVASAGTRPAGRIHPRALDVLRRADLEPLAGAPARYEDVCVAGDLIVSVCDSAHEELAAAGATPTIHWSIPDPAPADSRAAFESAFTTLQSRVDTLVASLPEGHHP